MEVGDASPGQPAMVHKGPPANLIPQQAGRAPLCTHLHDQRASVALPFQLTFGLTTGCVWSYQMQSLITFYGETIMSS